MCLFHGLKYSNEKMSYWRTNMLTQEHQNVYHDQGYVIIPNFFNKREVEAMQAELQRFINEGLGRM